MVSSTLQARLDVIRGPGTVPPEVLERFAAWVRGAEEEELYRMSPVRWGRANGADDRVAIDLFLRATHAGILEFSWGTVCPFCGGFLSTHAGLRALTDQWCAMCDIEVPPALSDSVEVAFTVSPAIRRIRFHSPQSLDIATDGAVFLFSGNVGHGAATRAHFTSMTVAGGRLEPHSAHTERTALREGRYLLFVPASNTGARFVTSPGAERDDLEIDLFDGHAVLSTPVVRPGRLDLTLRNKSGQTLDYLLLNDPKPEAPAAEHCDVPVDESLWLSGRRLLTSQTFQELFRAESIPAEAGIDVKALSILFTDLQGSTALYQRVGDLKAFESVRAHFDVLRDCVAQSGGAVVKTIGDAVMAAFSDPREAAEAAVQMHRRITRVAPGDLALKVGLHEGPCLAVALNDRLDYFGTTVNIAARVQGKAAGGEIVLTETSYAAPGVESVLRAAELAPTRERVSLKGIDGEVPIVRLRRGL